MFIFQPMKTVNALIRCMTYVDFTSELFSLQDMQLGELKFLKVVIHR